MKIESIYLSSEAQEWCNYLAEFIPDGVTVDQLRDRVLGSHDVSYLLPYGLIAYHLDYDNENDETAKNIANTIEKLQEFLEKQKEFTETTGEVTIFGDKEKLGYFLREGVFAFGGKK